MCRFFDWLPRYLLTPEWLPLLQVFPGMLHEVLRHKDRFDSTIAVIDQHLAS